MSTIGLFGARADRRGLARLSSLLWHHLCPDKTLLVDMSHHRPFPTDTDAYPGADVLTLDSVMGAKSWDWWLDGLDTVLLLETDYDSGIIDAARGRGVKSVLLVMPEYDHGLKPDVLALPTPWLAMRYPGAPILPIPVEPWLHGGGDDVVHPGGSPAKGDRNGTRIVLEASKLARVPVVVRAQSPPDKPWHSARVEVADLPTHHDVFDGAACVVLPRRYGGLSLPLLDAVGAGLPIIATAAEPYGGLLHPAGRLAADQVGDVFTPYGNVPQWRVDPHALARAVNKVMGDDKLRAEMAAHSADWAQRQSWPMVRDRWAAVLAP